MQCPKCGYVMDPFATKCIRCARQGEPQRIALEDIPDPVNLPPWMKAQREQQPTTQRVTIPHHAHPNAQHLYDVILRARSIIDNPEGYVILDTETTGFTPTAEVIEISIIGIDGSVLISSFVKPEKRKSIPAVITEKTGITMAMLKEAPTFRELLPRLQEITQGKVIIAYNAKFDKRVIDQTANKYQAGAFSGSWLCAMLDYAQYVGEVNSRFNQYKWHKLPGAAHRSIKDCEATLAIIKRMAMTELPELPPANVQQPNKGMACLALLLMFSSNPCGCIVLLFVIAVVIVVLSSLFNGCR